MTDPALDFRLFGYCLVSNYFHVLIRPEPGQSSFCSPAFF